MHSEFQFLEILFRLTIFLLLAYKAITLTKARLIPILYGEIKDERDSRQDLIEKENLLISNQHKLETQIRHQHLMFESLEKNIQNWQNMLLNQKISKEDEFNRIKNLIEEKREKQQTNYTLLCTSKDVLPTALCTAEAKLREKYQEQRGNILFDDLVVKITAENK